ncbi:MAG: nitric oxide reductase, partial [Alphaproteobacteria bacterium]|nr:nitric oxide reductase [Alphaproteobacteria bacterium]
MTLNSETFPAVGEDRIGNILKWVLLAVAIVTFGLLSWTTVVTYEQAPPLPDRFVTTGGAAVLTEPEIYRGKQGFQRADLMDYGSLYGMGSYFGEDYTADALVKLATQTEENIALTEYGKPFADLSPEHKTGVKSVMQAELQQVDLTQKRAVIPHALATAIETLRATIADKLLHNNFTKGWTKADSLDAQSASDTAGFLIY